MVAAPEPPAFGTERLPITEADVAQRFVANARTAQRGSAPSAAIDRVRHVPVDQAASSAPGRTLPEGVAVVGDSYLAGRLGTPHRPRDARRARLAVATGDSAGADKPAPLDQTTTDLPASRADPEPLVAATGRRLLGVRFLDAGPKTLRLQHRSPYSDAPPVDEYVLHALVEPRRLGFSIDQLLDDPEETWVGPVRDRRLHTAAASIDDPDAD